MLAFTFASQSGLNSSYSSSFCPFSQCWTVFPFTTIRLEFHSPAGLTTPAGGALVDARDRQHDEVGGKARAVEWLNWLNAQAMGAPSVEARAALDGNRVAAAVRAGQPEFALVAIQASERDLPADYNPPARLATVLREMGRYDDALAASDRALAKVYGPRTIRLWEDRATIFEKKGDPEGAKGALKQAIAFASSLPPSERIKRTIDRLEKRLSQVGSSN